MAFALATILLCAVAAIAALWPVLSRPRAAEGRTNDSHVAEVATLKAALVENDRDRDSGRISNDDAAAARAELGRRLLALTRTGGAEPHDTTRHTGSPRILVPALTALAVPLAAVGLYAATGSPALPDRPIAARQQAPDATDMPALIARAEAQLAQDPDDVRGWASLAPIYRRQGRFADSRDAWRRALPGLTGIERSFALTEIVEITAVETNGIDETGQAMLAEALSIAPDNSKADFLLVAAREAGSDDATRLAEWRALVERHRDAPGEWLPLARQRIASLSRNDTPTAGEIVTAPDAGRDEMIAGMVDGLASRLAEDPDDAEGWLRLIRSYAVLNRHEEAATALGTAKETFTNDAEVTRRLAALEREIGLVRGAPAADGERDAARRDEPA